MLGAVLPDDSSNNTSVFGARKALKLFLENGIKAPHNNTDKQGTQKLAAFFS
jgi:hypothetical protein